MLGMLATILLSILRWIAEKNAQQKLNDKQFIEFIEAHQARSLNTGKTATNFEDSLQETLAKIEEEKNKK